MIPRAFLLGEAVRILLTMNMVMLEVLAGAGARGEPLRIGTCPASQEVRYTHQIYKLIRWISIYADHSPHKLDFCVTLSAQSPSTSRGLSSALRFSSTSFLRSIVIYSLTSKHSNRFPHTAVSFRFDLWQDEKVVMRRALIIARRHPSAPTLDSRLTTLSPSFSLYKMHVYVYVSM